MKKLYILSGWIWYGYLNVVSYTNPSYAGPWATKIIYSLTSAILLILLDLILLEKLMFMKKPYALLTLYTKIMLHVGILVVPLISLYYRA